MLIKIHNSISCHSLIKTLHTLVLIPAIFFCVILAISGCDSSSDSPITDTTEASPDDSSNTNIPIAKAGFDQTGPIGDPMELDGSASYDPDGGSLIYSWDIIEKPEGCMATLEQETTSKSTFTADYVGEYTVQLTVINDHGAEMSDTCSVTAYDPSSQNISGNELYRITSDICNIGWRRAGTENMFNASNYLLRNLQTYGIQTRVESINFNRYDPKHWELTLINEGNEEVVESAYPIWYAGPTPPGGIEAEVVYLGYGTESDYASTDVEGKIILVNLGYRVLNLISLHERFIAPDSFNLAVENGAAGFLGFWENTPLNLAVPYTPGEGPNKELILPGVSMGKEDGFRLKKICENGTVKARLEIESSIQPFMTHTVIGLLPGMTDDIIMIDTHYCSWFEGATDNANSNAAFLVLARYYAGIPKESREKTMLFVAYGTHEYLGCNIGAVKFLQNNPDLKNQVMIDVGLDFHVGDRYTEAGGQFINKTEYDGMAEIGAAFMSENPVLYSLVMPKVFAGAGFILPLIPEKIMAMCETGVAYTMGIAALRITSCPFYYHTTEDTMDKFQPWQIEKMTKMHVKILDSLQEIPASTFKLYNIFTGEPLTGCATFYLHDPSILVTPEKIEPNFYSYDVHDVSVTTVSFLHDFKVDEEEGRKYIQFIINGVGSTQGFCELNIPMALMDQSTNITIDGETIDFNIEQVNQYYKLSFTYIHKTRPSEVVIGN